MMARKPGGVDWGSGAGGSRRIPELSSYAVRPWNGSVPATIEYSMTPNAHRSLRASVGSPRSTSGAIYCSVPTAASPSVSDFCERVTSSSSAPDRRFAKPKSSTFAWHWSVMTTFAVFRSRWTMPRSWAWATASAIWIP